MIAQRIAKLVAEQISSTNAAMYRLVLDGSG